MPFTGKSTYSAGPSLPEIAEDVADLVAVNSPHETPLLAALGDPGRSARSTVHEWLEDALLPDADELVGQPSANRLAVAHPERFRPGDQVRVESSGELVVVDAVDPLAPDSTGQVAVQRGHGGTSPVPALAGTRLSLLGNAALEGADAAVPRYTTRVRRVNYTQIFGATVEVSGTDLAVTQHGVDDELDYQKVQRTRELLRDLENSVINGAARTATPQGGPAERRTMAGLLSLVRTHRFAAGYDGFPDADPAAAPGESGLTEPMLNLALREVWKKSSGTVDLVVVGGPEKRAVNRFAAAGRTFGPAGERYKDLVSLYESDFGVCRVVLSRHVPRGTAILLDSSRIEVMPLAGRSFHYRPLARTGDRDAGQVIGEYTLELRNESSHAVIEGLAA